MRILSGFVLVVSGHVLPLGGHPPVQFIQYDIGSDAALRRSLSRVIAAHSWLVTGSASLTPRKNSNIIFYVDARELKKENMVKLPVIVYNRNSRNRVIQDAIQVQGILEKQAMTEEQTSGRYIRPIVLFQA